MMQRENRCAKCVRLQVSEVEVKLSTEHVSLNATNTGSKTVLSRFRLRHFACENFYAENMYAVKCYASLQKIMNQSLFFLAYKGELMQVQVRIACILRNGEGHSGWWETAAYWYTIPRAKLGWKQTSASHLISNFIWKQHINSLTEKMFTSVSHNSCTEGLHSIKHYTRIRRPIFDTNYTWIRISVTAILTICVKYHQENMFTWHHWNRKFSPRHANFVMCMLSETLLKHCNDALSMSFICYQTLDCDKASNFSERIS